ncbi:hypothetical protein Cantr_07348 [Candida viswanathii]|uniref:Non-haem dioxygenase N-terminal domain-containing protein n=1 Tax=Candida viswanathii TaxID=5486 RepID=A0A367Y270_9ASCO|nr:hypothetical protein Cantr_07348 [Candida viswanathii]
MTSSNPLKVIDISEDSCQVARSIIDAATTQGFLFVEGHDFTQQEVDQLFAVSEGFFKLPESTKQSILLTPPTMAIRPCKENLGPSVQKQGDPKEALNFAGLNFETGQSRYDIPDWFTEEGKELSWCPIP